MYLQKFPENYIETPNPLRKVLFHEEYKHKKSNQYVLQNYRTLSEDLHLELSESLGILLMDKYILFHQLVVLFQDPIVSFLREMAAILLYFYNLSYKELLWK